MQAANTPIPFPPMLVDMTEEQLIAAWEHASDMYQITVRSHGHCNLASSQAEVGYRANRLMSIEAEIRRRDPEGVWTPAPTDEDPRPSNPWLFGVLTAVFAGALMAWGIPALIRGAAWLIAWDFAL